MTHAHSNLKRYAIWVLVLLCLIELFVAPLDVGRYSQTFDDYGVVGFLFLPSLLVFQIGYLALVAFLVNAVLRAGLSGRFRVIAWLLGLAVTAYCLSLWGIHQAWKAGEFGIGAAAVFGLFGFLPSAMFIYIVAPVIFLYGITKMRPTFAAASAPSASRFPSGAIGEASPSLSVRPLMKRCPYCGKEYANEYSVCALDETPLESCAAKPRKSQRGIVAYILIPVLLVGFDYLIDPHFFSLKNIKVLFSFGLLILFLLVWGAFWLQTKSLKRRLAKAMKEALKREAREGKATDVEDGQ